MAGWSDMCEKLDFEKTCKMKTPISIYDIFIEFYSKNIYPKFLVPDPCVFDLRGEKKNCFFWSQAKIDGF